jgi:hypothetical protein
VAIDPTDPDSDPFAPPKIPTQVCCLHCGEEFDSYLIQWRVKTRADGTQHGFWCCPTPGCDGVGFGCDLLPTDPDYQDEHGGWVHDEDDTDDLDIQDHGFNGPSDPPLADEDIPF